MLNVAINIVFKILPYSTLQASTSFFVITILILTTTCLFPCCHFLNLMKGYLGLGTTFCRTVVLNFSTFPAPMVPGTDLCDMRARGGGG